MSRSKERPTESNLLQEKLSTLTFYIGLLLIVVIIVIMYFFGKDSEYENQIYSVAASLIASTVFALIFNLFANKEFISLIKKEISTGKYAIASVVIDEINKFHDSYTPCYIYSPTSGIDTVFNNSLTVDLKASTFYLFQGVSAKYVPIRVKHLQNTLSSLKIIILNPMDKRSISMRASDRLKNPKYQSSSSEDNDHLITISQQIKDEIYMSIIALFDCRTTCSVEIAYSLGTSVTRLEIFDEALYLSLYHTQNAQFLEFPETLRYSKKSIHYNLHCMDSFRKLEVSNKKIIFDRTNQESDLVAHL